MSLAGSGVEGGSQKATTGTERARERKGDEHPVKVEDRTEREEGC